MLKARSAYLAVLVCSAFAAVPAASAQAASITVNQDCIDVGSPATGGGLVSGHFSGAPYGGSWPGSPTGSQYDPQGYVLAGHNPGDDQHNYGLKQVTVGADGNGTFSFNLAAYYGSALPDTLWIKLQIIDYSVQRWVTFAQVEVWVCGREPDPEPIYDFDGFFEPVENQDEAGQFILNKANAGSTIPLKFRLGGDYGLDVLAEGYPKSEPIACDSTAEVNGIDSTEYVGHSGLAYHSGSGTYTYGWKTSKAWADTCRQLVVKFDDGTTARANFKFH